MKKKVAFISPFFHPEKVGSAAYNYYLCEALAIQENVELVVFCLKPFYPEWSFVDAVHDGYPYQIQRSDCNFRFSSNHIIRRLQLEVAFLFFLIRIFFRIKRFDTIIQVIPPTFFSVFVSLVFGNKTVTIVHDFQSLYYSKTSTIGYRILKAIEDFVFRFSKRNIFLTQGMLSDAIGLKKLSKNLVAYPFFAEKKSFSVLSPNQDFFVELVRRMESESTAVYAGSLGEKQDSVKLGMLLSEISKKSSSKVASWIISSGPKYEELKRQYEGEINFSNLLPDELVAPMLNASTVQIVTQALGMKDASIPSKIPNILAAGTPLFGVLDSQSEIYLLLKEDLYSCIVDTWESEYVVQQLLEFIERMKNVDKNVVRASRSALLKKFDVQTTVNNILSTHI